MEPTSARVHLTSVVGAFHARVLEARLAAEGVAVELRGLDEGPYPLALPVHVLVDPADLAVAREILLADAVDAAFVEPALAGGGSDPTGSDPTSSSDRDGGAGPSAWRRLRRRGAR